MNPRESLKWTRGTELISTDPSKLDLPRIHAFLSTSYWAKGIPMATVERAIAGSLAFGIYSNKNGRSVQIGFARVISDFATFAYLADVYVEADYRGKGLSKWLMECIVAHPALQGLRRFSLGTRDAHGLYRQFGFEVIRQPENWMEIKRAKPYGTDAKDPS